MHRLLLAQCLVWAPMASAWLVPQLRRWRLDRQDRKLLGHRPAPAAQDWMRQATGSTDSTDEAGVDSLNGLDQQVEKGVDTWMTAELEAGPVRRIRGQRRV